MCGQPICLGAAIACSGGGMMASIAASLDPPQVTVGSVFERAFATVRHNPAMTIGLSFLLGAVPAVAFELLLSGIDRSALVLTIAGYALPGIIALTLLQHFVSVLVGVIM